MTDKQFTEEELRAAETVANELGCGLTRYPSGEWVWNSGAEEVTLTPAESEILSLAIRLQAQVNALTKPDGFVKCSGHEQYIDILESELTSLRERVGRVDKENAVLRNAVVKQDKLRAKVIEYFEDLEGLVGPEKDILALAKVPKPSE